MMLLLFTFFTVALRAATFDVTYDFASCLGYDTDCGPDAPISNEGDECKTCIEGKNSVNQIAAAVTALGNCIQSKGPGYLQENVVDCIDPYLRTACAVTDAVCSNAATMCETICNSAELTVAGSNAFTTCEAHCAKYDQECALECHLEGKTEARCKKCYVDKFTAECDSIEDGDAQAACLVEMTAQGDAFGVCYFAGGDNIYNCIAQIQYDYCLTLLDVEECDELLDATCSTLCSLDDASNDETEDCIAACKAVVAAASVFARVPSILAVVALLAVLF